MGLLFKKWGWRGRLLPYRWMSHALRRSSKKWMQKPMKTRRLKTRWGNKQTKEFRMIGKRSRARLGKQGSPAERTEVIGQSQSKPWGCCQLPGLKSGDFSSPGWRHAAMASCMVSTVGCVLESFWKLPCIPQPKARSCHEVLMEWVRAPSRARG